MDLPNRKVLFIFVATVAKKYFWGKSQELWWDSQGKYVGIYSSLYHILLLVLLDSTWKSLYQILWTPDNFLTWESANYGIWETAKSGLLLILVNKVLFSCLCMVYGAFMLQEQGGVAVTKNTWPMKPEIFILWTFTESLPIPDLICQKVVVIHCIEGSMNPIEWKFHTGCLAFRKYIMYRFWWCNYLNLGILTFVSLIIKTPQGIFNFNDRLFGL